MKVHWHFFIMGLFMMQLCSCKQDRFRDEDLINRYINENAASFDTDGSFYLLVFQNPPLTCYREMQRHEFETFIPKLIDSLNNPRFFVVSSNQQTLSTFDTLFASNSLIEIMHIESAILAAYGFPVTPHLFKIDKWRVKGWKSFEKEAVACW